MLGVASKSMAGLAGQQSVRYSSGRLKELGIRIKSVTNIQKITKTMNMISSAKYAKAAKGLNAVRGFREAGAGVVASLNKDATPAEGTHLIFICSSDRGLCGALHTNTGRAAMALAEQHADAKYVIIGEKVRVFFKSQKVLDKAIITVEEVGRADPSFADCAAIAQTVLEGEQPWTGGTILYNHHKSAMTQIMTEVPVSSTAGLEAADGISAYDSVDGDVIQNFAEFALASSLYGCVKENYCSEQAARMISMDGATKNAGDMIDRMKLQFNRLRQAVITTELCEIIAGMSAL